MSFQFIFGPSGSGKSYQLYQNIIEESRKRPKENFIVLVPEQFTMQTQKDLVMQHPSHCIMNIDVLSFGRLAYRVFEETGGGILPVLDDEGKNLILRKIAADYEDDLLVLKGNMKKIGYISEVKSAISEFTQYDIGEEELERIMEAAGEGSGLYYKLMDLQVLYRGFTDYLQKKYITKEELLDVLSREIPKSELLKNSTVVLDGFTGFTPVQNRLLRELMLRCRKVVVTVIMDERENPYACKHPYQLFALSKRMVTSLVEITKEAKVRMEEPVCLYGGTPWRFRENEVFAFLEHHLFRYGKETYKKEREVIGLHAARNPKEESVLAAGEIRRLVRKENYRYRDIGVIVSNMDVYGDYLEQAFEAYDIPVFMDHKRSILLNPFVEYIRSLLNMAEQNFTCESVFRFLRTGLSGLSYEEVCGMENYVIGTGIKGYKRWQERWVRRLRGMKEEELAHVNHCRVMFVEMVDELVFVLRQRKKTVKDITMAVYQFMVKEDLQKKLKIQEEAFQEAGDLALAKEYAQIYRILIELLEKFVELLGDEPVSLSEYGKLLDAGLAEARVGVIPPGVDQVVVGDVKRTRLKDIKALLFLGANDAYLPGTLLRTGLLTERDRECFQKERLPLSPGGKEEAYIQKFYLYMNLTKPSEKLDIYYSKVSSDGKSMRPSYLVQEIRRLYPLLPVQDEEEKGLSDRELTEQMGMDALIQGFLSPRGMDQAWQELYSWYLGSPEWKEKAERLLLAGYYHRPADGLTRAVARKLYGEDFEDSITRIERFSACAFAHFLSYGLGLRERQEYEFQAVDLGNVCHSALERFSRKVEEAGVLWTELTGEEADALIGESVEEVITDYGNSVLYSSARNEYMIVRMKKLLARTVWALTEQLRAGDFVPSAYELRFGNGKIDRIDTCEDGDRLYVKVLDYKTGGTAFDVAALYYGLQLQLMVYMDAALREQEKRHPGKEVIPAGVFYYRIQDPLVEKKEDQEETGQDILKELKPDGMINLKDEVLFHLDRQMEGESMAAPLKYNKNGSLSKSSKAVPEEEFQVMMRHAVKKVQETHRQILSGKTDALPYRRGQESGCDYCGFRHVCGFDVKIPGFRYRDIGKMSKEEAIAAMKRKTDEVRSVPQETDRTPGINEPKGINHRSGEEV